MCIDYLKPKIDLITTTLQYTESTTIHKLISLEMLHFEIWVSLFSVWILVCYKGGMFLCSPEASTCMY